jgi:NADH-quinone oxidoreductase subunit K
MITISSLWPLFIFVSLIFISGIYCVIMTNNLIKLLIGLELMIKAVTLLLIVAGYVTNNMANAQALVITLIVIEVVIMTVAVGVVLGIYFYTGSLDARQVRRLKG